MKISVVTPFYNEEEVIPIFFEAITSALSGYDDFEIICVDDGSSDSTLQQLISCRAIDPRIKVVELSRNFGKEAALTAGLQHSCGDCTIIIDADLQDPPEIIPEMIAKWKEGADVVMGRRAQRKSDSLIKRMTARGFYQTFNYFADDPIPENVGDFRLIDRKVLQIINLLKEKNRFMKGLLSWPGFDVAFVDYERPERAAGETKWNYPKLFGLAIDGILAFSTVPLRLSFILGFVSSVFAVGYAIFLILRTTIQGVDLPGYASIMVVSLTFSGLILICLGVIGEYLGRIYIEVKQRPIYVIKKLHGDSPADRT
ncbi:MAG: glycosyltransferase family 2 protein [Verrucomicrobiales bacterium]|nr:glycosyltransferase family 2 protein [Verrucomicrobiales bacterium]